MAEAVDDESLFHSSSLIEGKPVATTGNTAKESLFLSGFGCLSLLCYSLFLVVSDILEDLWPGAHVGLVAISGVMQGSFMAAMSMAVASQMAKGLVFDRRFSFCCSAICVICLLIIPFVIYKYAPVERVLIHTSEEVFTASEPVLIDTDSKRCSSLIYGLLSIVGFSSGVWMCQSFCIGNSFVDFIPSATKLISLGNAFIGTILWLAFGALKFIVCKGQKCSTNNNLFLLDVAIFGTAGLVAVFYMTYVYMDGIHGFALPSAPESSQTSSTVGEDDLHQVVVRREETLDAFYLPNNRRTSSVLLSAWRLAKSSTDRMMLSTAGKTEHLHQNPNKGPQSYGAIAMQHESLLHLKNKEAAHLVDSSGRASDFAPSNCPSIDEDAPLSSSVISTFISASTRVLIGLSGTLLIFPGVGPFMWPTKHAFLYTGVFSVLDPAARNLALCLPTLSVKTVNRIYFFRYVLLWPLFCLPAVPRFAPYFGETSLVVLMVIMTFSHSYLMCISFALVMERAGQHRTLFSSGMNAMNVGGGFIGMALSAPFAQWLSSL